MCKTCCRSRSPANFGTQRDEVFSDVWGKAVSKSLEANPTHSTDDKYVCSYLSVPWPAALLWIPAHGLMVSAVNVVFLAPMVTIGKDGNISASPSSDGWTNGTV